MISITGRLRGCAGLLCAIGLAGWNVATSFSQVVGPNVNISGLAGQDPKLENMPVLASSGNKMVAAWHYAGNRNNVRLSVSLDGGTSWEDSVIQRVPGMVIDGRASICIDAEQTAYCAMLGAELSGSTVFVYSRPLVADAAWVRRTNAVPIVSFTLDKPDGIRLTCDRISGVLYLVYTFKPGAYEGRIQLVRSTDGGGSWSAPLELSGSQCNTAQLELGPDGELYVVWEDYAQRAIVGRKSVDRGVTFGPPFNVGTINDNVGLGPPGWRYSWLRDPMVPNMTYMDFPAFLGLAVDRSSGPRRGSLYAVWAEHGLGTADPEPKSGVAEVEPNNFLGNATPVEIGDDFGGYMRSADLPPYGGDGDIFTFLGTAGTTIQISGAATECHPFYGCYESAHGVALYCGSDTLNLTLINAGIIYNDAQLPRMIYTLPTTGRYYLSAGGSASTSIYYSISLREYVVGAGEAARDHRDIVMVRSTDGGLTWSDKVRVNDDPPLHDESFPAVEVDQAGSVHVAWYGRRDEPECGARVNTYWTWSEDGGQTFAPSRRISDRASDAGTEIKRWQVGDHLELHAQGDKMHLLWTYIPEGDPLDGEIYGVTITDMPTSIAVGRFAAEVSGDRVVARWSAGDERGVSGYRIHRAESGAGLEPVAFVAASGRREYRWEDAAVRAGERYRYQLEVVRLEGPSSWEDVVEIEIASPQARLLWRGAAPNPFDDEIVLALEGVGSGPIRVQVFDVAGHAIATLRPIVTAGVASIRWTGADDSGRPAPPGIYLVRAENSGRQIVRRVVRMR